MNCSNCSRDLKEDAKYCDICGKDLRRNEFFALCEYAFTNNLCSELYCSTCGCLYLRAGLSKIIRGYHPDDLIFRDKDFVTSEDIDEFTDFGRYNVETTYESESKLAEIVSKVDIKELKEIAPLWLGYIRFVLFFCGLSNESRSSKEPVRKISESFIPQFMELLREDDPLKDYLKQKLEHNEPLSIEDLERIEHSSIVGNRRNEDLDQ
jgi:hypothetical protein